ncbi:argininosuccinate lyase [Candidatus Peregrinibacteria bacterium]|nr:MAG: argininosuccinate lyase [Candidatus Peregrinibacteria bacterium]
MSTLWQKSSQSKINPLINQYTVGDDWQLDHQLFPYDIEGSIAHATMLQGIGILNESEHKAMVEALKEIKRLHKKGEIQIRPQDEDSHTVIEQHLIEKLGKVGAKIHTGRSRNDQVLVAIRLFAKHELTHIMYQMTELIRALKAFAQKHKWMPLPGYTHTQQAMLSSVGHTFMAYVESLQDDQKLIQIIQQHVDQNPLGSAAGFGVSFPLNREATTQALHFHKTQNNSLYCQNSRGKFEGLILEGLVQVMMSLGRIATDLLFWTSQECQFFSSSDQIVTGSSIMPQKRNLDVCEIIRANGSVVMANQQQIQGITKNLISGYHRDLQLIKKPLIESLTITSDSIAVGKIVVENIVPNQKRIERKISTDIFAADVANHLVQNKHIPFREAYQKAMDQLNEGTIDLKQNLKSKISPGAPGTI